MIGQGPIRLNTPTVLTRDEHTISRKQISRSALKVLYRLHEAGFAAYLVGGCVRDLLLGREPKDFDVATNASPEEIHQLFRNSLLIGRRFRLVHVRFSGEIIEVATFRQSVFLEEDKQHQNEHGMLLRDNQYGTIEEDVIRRDFTVNALYYNIANFSVLDFVQGMQDLRGNLLRIIGDPLIRFREDPVRILRAVRFAAKLSFNLEPKTAEAIPLTSELLKHVSAARLFDEVIKLLAAGCGEKTFALLRQYNLLTYLFPLTHQLLNDNELHQEIDHFVMAMLRNTDIRITQNKIVNPAFMFAVLLWHPRQKHAAKLLSEDHIPMEAYEQASSHVITQQVKYTAIPRRITTTMREIWQMQYHLERRKPFKAMALVYMQRFRAAYDFLLLRAEIEPQLAETALWWTHFYDADDTKRHEMIHDLTKPKKKRRSKKKTQTSALTNPEEK